MSSSSIFLVLQLYLFTMDDKDLEKGLGSSSEPSENGQFYDQTNPNAARPQPNKISHNPHPGSELEIFQGLVGIHFLKEGGGIMVDEQQLPAVSPIKAIFWPSSTRKQRMRNRGLYNRAVTQDLKNRTMYTITHYIITGLYILQVLVAATFTALSAYKNSSTAALTTLGAINTVVAGLLAWLTGQGMPTRYRRARDQYREVVRACEAMERRFAQINMYNWPDGTRPDPIVERDKLNAMFELARKDQEANYPSTTQNPQGDKDKDKAGDLRDEVAKWKTKKKEQEKQIQSLRKELEEAKGAIKAGMKGGEQAMKEIIS